MPRKKISTDADVIEGIAELNENEEIVIEDRRTVRKQKSKPPPEPEPIEDFDFDDDETDAEPEPEFSPTSIAALIFGGDANKLTDQFCSVAVRRKPDSMRDRFATPCNAVTNYPALQNIAIDAEQSEIEEIVREQYGGGHYFFQVRYGNRLANNWQATLADLPAAFAPKPETTATAAAAMPAAVPIDPLDNMLSNLAKMKALKDSLFGDEEARLKEQIAELKEQIANRPEPTPAEPLPDNIRILEKALGVNNPTLQERLIDAAFPEESASHWIPETVKTIFEHKEEIGQILGGILGSLAGPQPAASPAAMADLLRRQPPAALPAQPADTAPVSNFRRGPTRSDDGDDAGEIADTVSTNAEIDNVTDDEPNSDADAKEAGDE